MTFWKIYAVVALLLATVAIGYPLAKMRLWMHANNTCVIGSMPIDVGTIDISEARYRFDRCMHLYGF